MRVRPLLTLLAAAVISPSRAAPRAVAIDVLIRGATVYDGTGGPARTASIGMRGDRIVFVGAVPAGTTAQRVIDATGLAAAPGFIDPHTHVYNGMPALDSVHRLNVPSLTQGVTTAMFGADGSGPTDIGAALAEAERLGIGTNAFAMIGFGAVREKVIGASAGPASAREIEIMRAMIAKGMQDGATGVSSGLFYAPQSASATDEVIAVVSAARDFGGVYASHIRDESSYSIGLLAAVREAIRIGCESGLTTSISHIKALGTDVWGMADTVLGTMRAARRTGCRVTADQYPWTASGTSLEAALVPRWAESGGRDSLRIRLNDPALRPRLVEEMRENLRRRGGDSTILIANGGRAAAPYIGRTLRLIAQEHGKPAVEMAIDILRTAGDVGIASFNMSEADIATFMRDPWVMTSSDGSAGHPRMYGTYPRKIRRYVMEDHVISLARMIQSSTSQVAMTYGLRDRGVLRTGAFADIVLFDPERIRDEATYIEPTVPATGIRWVFVNGQAAVREGSVTGVLAGRALRRDTLLVRPILPTR